MRKQDSSSWQVVLLLTLLVYSVSSRGQGLLDVLNESEEPVTVPVSATFKDTRIVNVQSNEKIGRAHV